MSKINIIRRPVEQFKCTFCLALERIFYLEKSEEFLPSLFKKPLRYIMAGWDSQQKFGDKQNQHLSCTYE